MVRYGGDPSLVPVVLGVEERNDERGVRDMEINWRHDWDSLRDTSGRKGVKIRSAELCRDCIMLFLAGVRLQIIARDYSLL